MNSMNIISTTGLSPVAAAPTAAPRKPISLIGVSSTRPRAERLEQTFGALERPAGNGDVLAHHDHVGIALELVVQRLEDGTAHEHA